MRTLLHVTVPTALRPFLTILWLKCGDKGCGVCATAGCQWGKTLLCVYPWHSQNGKRLPCKPARPVFGYPRGLSALSCYHRGFVPKTQQQELCQSHSFERLSMCKILQHGVAMPCTWCSFTAMRAGASVYPSWLCQCEALPFTLHHTPQKMTVLSWFPTLWFHHTCKLHTPLDTRIVEQPALTQEQSGFLHFCTVDHVHI